MSNSTPHFKTRARLLCQLGEQLIKSESVALLELIKNSYDADASECSVEILSPDDIEAGSITIKDDGTGMDYDILEHSWLEIGTNNKEEKKRNGQRSPKYNRISLGEKGIGRFGVHRLGRKIKVISRMKGKKECVLKIDWDQIKSTKYIEELPIELEEREPKYFENSTGTLIKITKLRNRWTRGTLREVARSVNTLNSPFESKGSFSVKFETNNNWLDGLLTYNDIKDKNLYKFSLKIIGNKIKNFSYDFTPYKELTKVKPRHVTDEEFKPMSRMIKMVDKNKYEDIDTSKYNIGEITIKGILFDLDSKIMSIGLASGKRDLKEYLAANGGIRVFRDNMRIWDYGEIDNDWLDLDAKRVNRPSFKLSNRLILAAVYLKSEQSTDLIEKANREGFVDNDAYKEFKEACSYVIDKIEFYRNQDKERIRRAYNTKSTTEVPVLDTIEDIKDLIRKNIENKINDKKIIIEIFSRLDHVSENYTRITENLIKSAGAGLNLIAVLHQIEKLIKNLKSVTSKQKLDVAQLSDNISILDKLVSGYGILARNYKAESQVLSDLVNVAIDNISFRFKVHKISIINKSINKNFRGFCSTSHFMNCIMNLFDNSIWWLSYSMAIDPKIYIDITDDIEGYSTVIIADNGPGFALSKDELAKPFLTAKPLGAGMGIGLHLTKEIMKSLHGRLLFPEPTDFSIPKEFQTGAIVALAFKTEK